MDGKSDNIDPAKDENEGESSVMALQSVNICDSITDTGAFAYSALVAVSLNQLFDSDGLFKTQVIDSLIAHLNQPEQVKSSICAIADGHGNAVAEPFVEALLAEAVVDGNAVLVVDDFIKLILKSGYYDSRMRVLVKHLSFFLRVTSERLEECEERILADLKEAEHSQTEEELDEEKRAARNKKAKRYFMIGLATVGGGALIGLTGGLAAPFVAAGAGAVIGGAGAAALGTATGIYVIGSLFGVAGAGLTGYKMKKRVGAIEQFEFMPIAESSQLHVTIAIAGWITKDEGDFAQPWCSLAHSKEQYCLKWESRYLLDMGNAINKIMDSVMTAAAQEALKYTVLSGIMAAIAWPASLMTLSGIIDNPWSVCLRRSQQVGQHLATVLLSRQQGRRPVSLIGFSLGARVIYYCLEEMSKRKGCEGIIEDVYMFGTPVSADPAQWKKFSHVVAGTITNGYCRGDWLLKFLYRTSSIQFNIAGLHPVKWDDRRIINIDLTDVVVGHTDYANKMEDILNIIGIPTKEQPKRITQLRLHPSWSKDSIRSPSNQSLSSAGNSPKHSSSPSKHSDTSSSKTKLTDSPSRSGKSSPSNEIVLPSNEINVAKDSSKLKRLTENCGEEDAEYAEDAWDFDLKAACDKSSSAVGSEKLVENSSQKSRSAESSPKTPETHDSISIAKSKQKKDDAMATDLQKLSVKEQPEKEISVATDSVAKDTEGGDVAMTADESGKSQLKWEDAVDSGEVKTKIDWNPVS